MPRRALKVSQTPTNLNSSPTAAAHLASSFTATPTYVCTWHFIFSWSSTGRLSGTLQRWKQSRSEGQQHSSSANWLWSTLSLAKVSTGMTNIDHGPSVQSVQEELYLIQQKNPRLSWSCCWTDQRKNMLYSWDVCLTSKKLGQRKQDVSTCDSHVEF